MPSYPLVWMAALLSNAPALACRRQIDSTQPALVVLAAHNQVRVGGNCLQETGRMTVLRCPCCFLQASAAARAAASTPTCCPRRHAAPSLQPGTQEGLGSLASYLASNCKQPLAIVHPEYAVGAGEQQ